jgi:beta-lactamase class A
MFLDRGVYTCLMQRILPLLLLVCVVANAETNNSTSQLDKQLKALIAKHDGKVGFYARNLRTKQQIAIGADEPVPTASTIKLLAFVEAFHQIKDGKKKLDDEILLRKEDQVLGSGVFQFFHTPLKITFEDALNMMMIQSDNTATNLVIDHLGRDNINKRGELLGLKSTYLYKKVYRAPDGPMPADQKKFGLGKTTAAEMAKLMEGIVTCELEDTALCKQMVSIMKNQAWRQMIPRYIEPQLDATEGESRIANKIGEIDASRSDVAAIWTDNGPIVISAYTYENKDQRWSPDNQAELLISNLAKVVYDAWSKPPKEDARVK